MSRPKKILSNIPPKNELETIPTDKEISPSEQLKISEVCAEIGMGLRDYLMAIQRGLTAKKISIDKYGEEHWEDDTNSQLKAAMMGLEAEGYIKNKLVAQDNRKFTQVTYEWKPVQYIHNGAVAT